MLFYNFHDDLSALTDAPSVTGNTAGSTTLMALKTGVGQATEKSKRKPRSFMTDEELKTMKSSPEAANKPEVVGSS